MGGIPKIASSQKYIIPNMAKHSLCGVRFNHAVVLRQILLSFPAQSCLKWIESRPQNSPFHLHPALSIRAGDLNIAEARRIEGQVLAKPRPRELARWFRQDHERTLPTANETSCHLNLERSLRKCRCSQASNHSHDRKEQK